MRIVRRGAIRNVLRPITTARHCDAVRAEETPAVPIILLDFEAAFVHQPMMGVAQKDEIGQARLAAGRPVLDMVGVHKAFSMTAGETATAVPRP